MISIRRFLEFFKRGLVNLDRIKLGKVLLRFVRMLSHAFEYETNK